MKQKFDLFGVLGFVAGAWLMLAPLPLEAQTTVSFQDPGTCWVWGGSSSAGQGQFAKCGPTVMMVQTIVTKTEVREVKVPTPVVVPGPVQRIEIPVTPAKQRE